MNAEAFEAVLPRFFDLYAGLSLPRLFRCACLTNRHCAWSRPCTDNVRQEKNTMAERAMVSETILDGAERINK